MLCALTGALFVCVLYIFLMDSTYVLIQRKAVEELITLMQRSERYCRNARPVSFPMSREDIYAEPTEFYSGANGYAGATLRMCIQTLESAIAND